MKNHFEELINSAYQKLVEQKIIPADLKIPIKIDRTRNKDHGDFSANAALIFSKPAGLKPRELAEKLVNAMPASEHVEKLEIAGPGFINVFLKKGTQQQIIVSILEQTEKFGLSNLGQGKKIHIEYVSANPTGPLHVGHGRGAAYGASLANVLKAVGYEVHREYYVNDAGRQMDILATSVWLRYLKLCGIEFKFPNNGYRGDYIFDIAASLHREYKDKFVFTVDEIFKDVYQDEVEDSESGDKEKHIDGLINNAKTLLTPDHYKLVFKQGLNEILNNIRQDLKEFGVEYDDWFSERSLTRSGEVDKALEELKQSNYLYEKNGTLWFKSSKLGDEKDRVVVRDNGLKTYLASDIAYHRHKIQQKYDHVINIWGADHHGYIPRVKAALQALNLDPNILSVLLVQFAILYRDGKKASMSTRSGEFVSLRELRQEVGNDAARFFYVLRKSEQHMDFDLDLAKEQSKNNPVYYIQYAHARVCSVIKKLSERQLEHDLELGQNNLDLLDLEYEKSIMQKLAAFPDTIEKAALGREPHQIAYYLRELANEFHSYYNAKDVTKILDEKSIAKRNARLNLSLAVKQVIKNGLSLLGVSAPESM